MNSLRPFFLRPLPLSLQISNHSSERPESNSDREKEKEEKNTQRWVSQREKKLIIARLGITPANYFQKIPKKKKEDGKKKGEKGDNYGACSCPTHEPLLKTLRDIYIFDLRLTVTVTPRRNIKGFSHTMIFPGGSENKGIYVLKEFPG